MAVEVLGGCWFLVRVQVLCPKLASLTYLTNSAFLVTHTLTQLMPSDPVFTNDRSIHRHLHMGILAHMYQHMGTHARSMLPCTVTWLHPCAICQDLGFVSTDS